MDEDVLMSNKYYPAIKEEKKEIAESVYKIIDCCKDMPLINFFSLLLNMIVQIADSQNISEEQLIDFIEQYYDYRKSR